MKKRFAAAVSLALCAAMCVCACSSAEEEDVFTGEKTDLPEWQAELDMISPAVYGTVDDLDLEPGTYISVIGKQEGSPYWEQVKAGVSQAAEDINERLGYSGSEKVKVLYNAPEDGKDVDEQVNILDEEMARYPDVIAIASIDENESAVQFDLAISNGIQIVAFDSGNTYQGIQCTAMTDNAAAAAEGADRLCGAIGESGEAALIVQDSVSANARERADAFQAQVTAGHPGVTVVETIYMDQLDDLKQQAAAEQLGVTKEQLDAWVEAASGVNTEAAADAAKEEQAGTGQPENAASAGDESGADSAEISEEARTRLEDIHSLADGMSDEEAVAYYLEKHPELNGCFGTNADAVLLAADAVKETEGTEEITVMGFDTGSEILTALEDGAIDGLVVQNPFGMGYAAVVAAARTALEIGNEAVVNTGYTWVDRENLEDENIQKILYE